MDNNGMSIHVHANDAVWRLVSDLKGLEREQAVKQGLAEGARVYVDNGRRNLRAAMKSPKGKTGNLIRSFSYRVKKYKPGAIAGFRHSGGEDGKGAHAYMVDNGTNERFHRSGKSTGAAKSLGFWTKTRNEDGVTAMEKVIDGVIKALGRLM